MPGLSISNRCIPRLRSCLASSDSEDSASVLNMTLNRPCTRRSNLTTGCSSQAREGMSAALWKSWELLNTYPKLPEGVVKKKLNISKKSHNLRGAPIQIETNHHQMSENPGPSTSNGIHQIYPIDVEVSTSSASNNVIDQVNNTSTHDVPLEAQSTLPSSWVESTDIIEGRLSNLSSDKEVTGTANGNYSNLPCSSRGAIPKQQESTKPSLTSEGENGLPICNATVRFEYPNSKNQDLKNMKSLLQQYTHSFGRDVIDNGIAPLDSKLPVHTTIDRLKTFKNWPNKRIEPKKLADAGFFYFGRADIVECFKCGTKGQNWVESDRPMEDHIKWNSNCPFVRENATEEELLRYEPSRDTIENIRMVILPNSRPENDNEMMINQNQIINLGSESSLAELGIEKTKVPRNQDQIIYETRLRSFENWPKAMKQKPLDLASAGFYYLGVGDAVSCFYCGGGLKDWDEQDDPWEQHALWYPKCNYLLLKKTPAFVEDIQKKRIANQEKEDDSNRTTDAVSCKKEENETVACCSSNSDTKETPSNPITIAEERKSEERMPVCKICYTNDAAILFLPCGHLVSCVDCASALKQCVVCRQDIKAVARAFLA